MAAFLDLCRFIATAGGTGDWTYSSTVSPYISPANAGAANGRVYKVRAESADLTQWEVSEGTYSSAGAGSFARTTVLYNSAGTGTLQSGAGTKITFTAAPQVWVVASKRDLISIEEANNFSSGQKAQAATNIGLGTGDSVLFNQLRYGLTTDISSTDINSLATSGAYVGSALTNVPGGNAGWFYVESLVYANSVNWRLQKAWPLDTLGSVGWYRTMQAGTWGPWRAIGGRHLLNTLNAANIASLDDTTSFTSLYNDYEVFFENLIPTTSSVTLFARVRTGVSFQSTSYTVHGMQSNGTAIGAFNSTSAFPLSQVGTVPNNNSGVCGSLRIFNTNAGGVYKGVTADWTQIGFSKGQTGGVYYGDQNPITGMQFLFSSGNVGSGVVKIFGLT
jgi:hypothetical protein